MSETIPYCLTCKVSFDKETLICPKCGESNDFVVCPACGKQPPIEEAQRAAGNKNSYKFLVYLRGGFKCTWCKTVVGGFSRVTPNTYDDFKAEGSNYVNNVLTGFKCHLACLKDAIIKIICIVLYGLLLVGLGYVFLKLLAVVLRWILKNY
ncbi:MAG TPA: hypothetical protein EYN71_02975 [Flavobacteriales bacterium]|nr:hypothetical protein [Flavobacteriales bacterium]HIN76089.1 hypothetical protein [Rhodospirillales bacterium]HIO67083.1 hypothetical protein [Flavobacteriales bacterium]